MNLDCGILLPYEKNEKKTELKSFIKKLTIVEKNTCKKPKGVPLIKRHAVQSFGSKFIVPRYQLKCMYDNKIIKVNNNAVFIGLHIVSKKYNINIDLINSIKKYIEYYVLSNKTRTLRLFKISIPLYDYQRDIVLYLLRNHFNNNSIIKCKNICYLQMQTGLGKTRVGCAVVSLLRTPALIVVPSIAIGDQWICECNEIYPFMSIKMYSNSKPIYPHDTDVVVIVVNTLYKKNIEFIDGYGAIIYDEAHEYHSKHFSKILWFAGNVKFTLGLSATPLERLDGLDRFVTLFLGEPIYANKITYISDQMFTCKVSKINYYGHDDYTEHVIINGNVSSILTIGKLIKDRCRVNMIINEINRLVVDGHGIFVFAEHRKFLDDIKENLLISDYEESDDPDIVILRGGCKENDLNKVKKGSHIVLTTYGFSRRGLSLVDMTSIILASPRRNGLKQIVGRILRKGSDQSIVREIVDIVDCRSILKGQYNEREKVYTSRNYPITTKNVYSNNKIDDKYDIDCDENINSMEDVERLFEFIENGTNQL